MSKLYVMVGLPGSGKSKYAKERLSEAVYVGSDAIREELYGDEDCQNDPGRVFAEAYKRADKALAEGRDVVLDSTALTKETRQFVMDGVHNANFIEFVFIDTPLRTCIERNEARKRVVPRRRMFVLAKLLERPTYDEGNCVRVVN